MYSLVRMGLLPPRPLIFRVRRRNLTLKLYSIIIRGWRVPMLRGVQIMSSTS